MTLLGRRTEEVRPPQAGPSLHRRHAEEPSSSQTMRSTRRQELEDSLRGRGVPDRSVSEIPHWDPKKPLVYNDMPGADATAWLYEWARRIDFMEQLEGGTRSGEQRAVPSRSVSELPAGSSGKFVAVVCVRLIADWVGTILFVGEVRIKKRMKARDGAVLNIQLLR